MNDAPRQTDAIEARRLQIRELMKHGDFTQALSLLETALADGTGAQDVQLLYMRAACLRYLKRHEEALECLQRLGRMAPEYARCWQETGHNYRAMSRDADALRAYRQAVSGNPGLIASWKAISHLAAAEGDRLAAQNANLHYHRLKALPRELASITSMLHEGRLYKAERMCRDFLKRNPHHVEAMRLLAQLGMRLRVLDDAEYLLESCLEFEPDNVFARFDYVRVLTKRQKYAQALQQAAKLRGAQPGNPSFESAYGNACMAVGHYDDALKAYDDVLKVTPDNSNILLMRGHALKTMGRQQDAVGAYHAARNARPDYGDAWWSLANLKTYRFEDAELETMRLHESRQGTTMVDRYHLCFALGKALEDREDFDASFDHYVRGNALKKAECRYDPERMAAEMERQIDTCDAELLAPRAGRGHPAPDPIFIVGLPRAGSTLIEQILASHSLVDGTFELPNIMAAAHRLGGRRRIGDEPLYPGVLTEMEDQQITELGERYIEDTRIHRGDAPYFLDKMPNNFQHLGLITMALPNARIIDARRDPMACCFSGFKQLFAEGQEFTYSLEDIGRYYRGYEALMAHWEQVIPDRILRVQYEDVVRNLETQVHRLLEFVGLEFEPACLEFHRTERSVRTASSEQVRQPLYASGLDYWRSYEPWLDPLKQSLNLD